MPKYIQRSVPFNAFRVGAVHWPEWLHQHWDRGNVMQDGEGRVFVKEHTGAYYERFEMLPVEPGDWIVENNDGFVRRVSAKVFEALYREE